MALELFGRAFAHQIHNAAHLAAAVEQAARAAHHFDAVEGEQVGQRAVDTLHLRRQAVDVVFTVFVAARINRRAAVVIAQHAQTRRFARQLVKGIDVTIFYLLIGDNADGLRNFAQRGGDFCADGGGKRAVIAVFLGGNRVIRTLPLNMHGFQINLLGGGNG